MSLNAIVMCLADPSGNPRPTRMIELLQINGFLVDVLSFDTKNPIKVNKHLVLAYSRKFHARVQRGLNKYLIKILRFFIHNQKIRDAFIDLQWNLKTVEHQLKVKEYDLFVVEDLKLLPLAFRLKRNGGVLFDAREYYPKQNEESLLWRTLERPECIRICKTYLSRCDHVITVSPGLANEYLLEFGIEPSVIMSVPQYTDIVPKPTNRNKIRLVHHGGANPNRQLEKMIDIVKMLDSRFTFDLYLTGASQRILFFKKYVKNIPHVRICDPVPFEKINSMLTQYDIGFYYLEPSGFNVTFNLPNKLFEFIQARLAIAIGPSPDMSTIVKKYNCGVIAKMHSLQSMADCLNSLPSTSIDEMKRQSHLAAKELCFEQESHKLLGIIHGIVRTNL